MDAADRSSAPDGGQQTLQEKAERLAAHGAFLGGAVGDHEAVGRYCLDVLVKEGMQRDSRVADVGCGALRVGVWLMDYLDPGHYCGIEPNQQMLNEGITELAGVDLVERSKARFDNNYEYDLSVFDEKFDFVLARSIWTHAPKKDISACLASFAQTAASGAKLLATYYPLSTIAYRVPRSDLVRKLWVRLPLEKLSPLLIRLPITNKGLEYRGDEWIGRSHESSVSGSALHSLRWIVAEAARHGLHAELASYPIVNTQHWIRVSAPQSVRASRPQG